MDDFMARMYACTPPGAYNEGIRRLYTATSAAEIRAAERDFPEQIVPKAYRDNPGAIGPWRCRWCHNRNVGVHHCVPCQLLKNATGNPYCSNAVAAPKDPEAAWLKACEAVGEKIGNFRYRLGLRVAGYNPDRVERIEYY